MPERRGDDHADGSGEDRLFLRYQAKRHCDVTQHTNYPNYVSDRIGRPIFRIPSVCRRDWLHADWFWFVTLFSVSGIARQRLATGKVLVVLARLDHLFA